MLKPKTNEEMSLCLKHCNARLLAVTPQAGNTNLVGGAVPVHDEVILNTSRMNQILGFDEFYGIVSSEAGVILRTLQNYTKERGYEVPLDLGAKDSCQIGGNLANNAGGLKVIRHNSMHANTIGLKMVLADGTILDNMTTLRKDNTGYDLKHLFIGSEGTLGMITECAMLCPPYPTKKHLAMVTLKSFEDVLILLRKAKAQLGDILYAYEVMDDSSVRLVLDQDKQNAVFPFGKNYPFYALIETGSSEVVNNEGQEGQKSDADLEKLFKLFDIASDVIVDGVVAQDMK